MSALEIFARIQHFGGPTRLIDVTVNPYIAAWFAIEENDETGDADARLFALSTVPVAKPEKPPFADGRVQLDKIGANRTPFWHAAATTELRQGIPWGTGARRRLWIPPAYEARSSAQNAGFVLDGVPITSASTSAYFSTGERNVNWRRADLLAASSIYVKTASATQKPRYNVHNFAAPTFSFRITAAAKREIRESGSPLWLSPFLHLP